MLILILDVEKIVVTSTGTRLVYIHQIFIFKIHPEINAG